MAKGSDKLNPEQRKFYEATVWKNVLSVMYFGTSLIFMGFVSQFGGRANWGRNYAKFTEAASMHDDSLYATYKTVMDGYGFATFCFFAAFVLSVSSSIYISPYITGSPLERMILTDPENFEKNTNAQIQNKLKPEEKFTNNLP